MRWLFTSWGSRGDLHPFLALGQGLLRRGHQVTLVGRDGWRREIEESGLAFASSGEPSHEKVIRENPRILTNKYPALRLMLDKLMSPGLEPTCAALLRLAPKHDVLVASNFVFPASIVAELTGMPWSTITLSPGHIPSAYSPMCGQYWRMGPGSLDRFRNSVAWSIGRSFLGLLVDPLVNQLRKKYHLKPRRDALYGSASRQLNLQLYSRHFAPRPPDWPAEIKHAGFCLYEPPGADRLSPEVEVFLARGEQPILFTLGTAAVEGPGGFYETAIATLEQLGLRGILLVGSDKNRPARVPSSVLTVDYASFGLLMPRVRAVVHQGGIGTISHVLRAGLPSVVCPYAFDQPNNGRRLEALGVAELLATRRRTPRHFRAALEKVLSGSAATQAARMGKLLRHEDGVALACDELERTFQPQPRAPHLVSGPLP